MLKNSEVQFILVILNTNKDIENIQCFISLHPALNWEKFSSYAIKHGVAAVIFNKLSDLELLHLLPNATLDLFKQQYYKTFARNTVLLENFKLVAEQAHKNNIDIILLNGISLINHVYDDIAMRPMVDIDILVKKEDVSQMEKILKSLNYGTNPIVKSKFIEIKEHFHLPAFIHRINHIMIELHTHIHESDSLLKLDISTFWENKIPVKDFTDNIGMLSPENLLQHLCMHIHEHYKSKKIRLSHFYDIVKVIEKYNNHGLDWNKFINGVVKFNLRAAIYPYLYLVQKHFITEIPSIISSHYNEVDKDNYDKYFNDVLLTNPLLSKEQTVIKQEELSRIKGFKNKLVYILGDLFPSRRFMIRRYQIKNKNLFIFYYVKRWFSAISRLFFIVFNRGKK